MFQLMMTWIGGMTRLPLGTGVGIEEIEDVNRIFVLYGIGFTIMAAMLVLLNATTGIGETRWDSMRWSDTRRGRNPPGLIDAV